MGILDYFDGRHDPEWFLAEFLPLPPRYPSPASRIDFTPILNSAQNERARNLVNLLQKHDDLCPDLVFWEDYYEPDPEDPAEWFPHVAGYVRSVSDELHAMDAADCYNEVELVFESTLAQFAIPSERALNEGLDFMKEVFAHQHRTHFFSVHICGQNVRFARWDRAAVVSTDFVDASTSARLLAEFFFRFGLLDRQGRGHDVSAVLASHSEQKDFRMAVGDFRRAYINSFEVPNFMQTLDLNYFTYKLRVDAQDSGNPQYYIVQRPYVIQNDEFFGSGMRGYVAWALREKEIVFIKDAWQLKVRRSRSRAALHEVEALAILLQHEVPFLPVIFGFGYVLYDDGREQATINQHHAEIFSGETEHYGHYRIAQTFGVAPFIAGRPRVLVGAIRNALYALERAHTTARIHHMDISMGNILADPRTMEGMLIDWDIACFCTSESTYGEGTRLYRSIWRLLTPRPYCLRDDVEACFWALLRAACGHCAPYYALRRKNDGQSIAWFNNVFSHEGEVLGAQKLEALMGSTISNLEFSSAALDETVHNFAAMIKKMYEIPGVDMTSLSAGERVRMLRDYVRHPYTNLEAEAKLFDIWPIINMLDDALEREEWSEPAIMWTGQYPDFTAPDQMPATEHT